MELAPFFIHVDCDDLWAIAECYGVEIHPADHHAVLLSALPRLLTLFETLRVRATFFIVGRDLEDDRCAALFAEAIAAGHRVANHSFSHSLGFRELSPEDVGGEIQRADQLFREKLGVAPVGFRAPGYGFRRDLLLLLGSMGYLYDSSLMPSPFGPVLRSMDRRLQQRAVPGKTQFPLLRDTMNWLYPVGAAHGEAMEFPVAACPGLRLPWQAGVCMAMGKGYFRTCFSGYRARPQLPGIFLMHAADLADLSGIQVPFFQQSRFFARPIGEREALASYFLQTIQAARPITTTEEWLSTSG